MSSDLGATASAAEEKRLAAVRRYDILDAPRDGTFDRVALLAARAFNVPIATVTIVDHDRIWFKAAQGLDVEQVGRDPGLCASAILQPDPYIVTDAIEDPRCLQNPLVRGEMGVRFYAAAPIRTPDGYNLGTVNVIDSRPRSVSVEEMGILQSLADIVADELEVRLSARRTVEAQRVQRDRAQHLTALLQQRLLPQRTVDVPGVEVATYYRPLTDDLQIGGDFFDVFDVDTARWAIAIGDVCGKGAEAAAVTGEIRSMLRAIARIERDPAAVLVRLNDMLYRDTGDSDDVAAERFCTAALVVLERRASVMTATIATAGHPLALVRRVDASVETFGRPGQLLGPFRDLDVNPSTADLQPGEMLLLYTDGAIEQRGVSIEVGQQGLAAGLASAPASDADTALEHVRQAVERMHGTYDDDIALVLVRVTP